MSKPAFALAGLVLFRLFRYLCFAFRAYPFLHNPYLLTDFYIKASNRRLGIETVATPLSLHLYLLNYIVNLPIIVLLRILRIRHNIGKQFTFNIHKITFLLQSPTLGQYIAVFTRLSAHTFLERRRSHELPFACWQHAAYIARYCRVGQARIRSKEYGSEMECYIS